MNKNSTLHKKPHLFLLNIFLTSQNYKENCHCCVPSSPTMLSHKYIHSTWTQCMHTSHLCYHRTQLCQFPKKSIQKDNDGWPGHCNWNNHIKSTLKRQSRHTWHITLTMHPTVAGPSSDWRCKHACTHTLSPLSLYFSLSCTCSLVDGASRLAVAHHV